MFIGYSRLHLGLSLFLVLDLLIGGAAQPGRSWHCFVILAIRSCFDQCADYQCSFRYQYYLIPLWILLVRRWLEKSGRLAAYIGRVSNQPVRTDSTR